MSWGSVLRCEVCDFDLVKVVMKEGDQELYR